MAIIHLLQTAFVLSLGATAPLLAADASTALAPLIRIPDLAPSLTQKEVAKPFGKWINGISGLPPDHYILKHAPAAKTALAPKLPRVAKITLYSLVPSPADHMESWGYKRSRIEQFRKLERFCGYPVLGQVTLTDPDEANRWVGFFRDQTICREKTLCDFVPRHGFRLTSEKGRETDLLMCFACSRLIVRDEKKFSPKGLPHFGAPTFSTAVQSQLNLLFDKLKIKRL